VLGRYELCLRVGAGGMGEVWAARRKGARGFAKLVAVKCLRPELAGRPEIERMFLDEAMIGSRIRHPHVVRVLDLGEQDGVLFQVLEWVVGEPLRCLLPRSTSEHSGVRPRPAFAVSVDPLAAARVVWQLAGGLHAAHELRDEHDRPMGVVHRDVSPDNVLVTAGGLAKLTDFGVASRAGGGVSSEFGTAAYLAPECVLGGPVDRRADVFGLGVLLYELIGGVHPFAASDDASALARIAGPVPALPLRTRAPDISPALDRLVSSALAKRPEARPPTAAELGRALERAVPGCALRGADERLAECMRRAAGEHVDARARALQSALRALDEAGGG
jgi:serine/threonine-protein kinase